jgi:hypothetical protein
MDIDLTKFEKELDKQGEKLAKQLHKDIQKLARKYAIKYKLNTLPIYSRIHRKIGNLVFY